MIHEREACDRALACEAFNALHPGVLGNPFIPHWPTSRQLHFLSAHVQLAPPGDVYESLYGGAAGGGKSDALLMAAAQYAWRHGDFAGVCIRRSYAELAMPGALMDRAMKWWRPAGAHWNGTDKLFTFPSGARVKMAYHGGPQDDLQFQSSEYQLACWDELTHWPDDRAYEWVSLSRLRRAHTSPVPLRALSASNPGGPGHTWVRDRFVGGVDIHGTAIPAPCYFVPARLADNPHLDRAAYETSLSKMHPTVRKQLLDGDWSARDPGDYFRPEWFGPLLDPERDEIPRNEARFVRWWDLAASERADAARTAGVLMARMRTGVRVIVHAVAFRKTPGARDDAIVQQAQIDGRHVTVGIEIEGGSGGPAQFEALRTRLRAQGYTVVGARSRAPQTDAETRYVTRAAASAPGKAARADPVASCLERGHQRRGECSDTGGPWWGADIDHGPFHARDGIRLFAGPWTREYLDEIEGFPEAARLDYVDATSGAWSWLEAHPVGSVAAPVEPPAPRLIANHGTHPDDRETEERTGRHWRP